MMKRSRIRHDAGQTVVEFALVLPFIVVVILALTDFGRALFMYLEAEHAASDAARLVAVDYTPASGTLSQYLKTNLISGELQNGTGKTAGAQGAGVVTICFPNAGARTRGNPVTVKVTNTFKFIPGGIIPGTATITGIATQRLEQNSSLTGNQASSGTASC